MKHILIILSLGILGAGLYWVAALSHSSTVPTSATAQSDPPITEPADTPEDITRNEPTPQEPVDVNPQQASAEPTREEQPSRLDLYGGVLKEIDKPEARKAPDTDRSASRKNKTTSNLTLKTYEATLKHINE